MESPVVVDKPPEYHGNDRGFPFDEEEGAGAWSELAARHPDIAARLRQRPATWARKRRPSSQDATDDFGENFGSFDRFPFDDIPPEFREHFPSHWNRRFGSREEHPQQTQAAPPPPPAQQHTAATQTEQEPEPAPQDQHSHLPQYGLRNTVDLGQKSPADPSLVDADDRNQRSMSAPPDSCAQNQSFKMSGQNHHEHAPQQGEQQSNVRHIPIFVEGRDEPVINKSVDHGARDHATHFGETKQTYAPPPPQPHIDREQYFADDGPVGFHHPPNFSRAFGTPFNKGYRQGPQPFVQQKVYPQAAYARGASPQRSQSPKPQPHQDEHFVKVPVYHDQAAPKTDTPSKPQQRQQPPPPPPPQQQQQKQAAPPHAPAREQTPPPKPQQTPVNDPITQILSIQTDVLNLMTEVENFTGTKKDKKYLFLDEMLTRNLIKLDTIETDGKENIRQARKEAIRCIQKCIAVLEAKAEKNASGAQPQTQDVEMKENQDGAEQAAEPVTENGEVDMKEETKEEVKEKVEPEVKADPAPEPQPQPEEAKSEATTHEEKTDAKPQEEKPVEAPADKTETQTQAADTRPEDKAAEHTEKKDEQKKEEEEHVDKPSPKKGTKAVKKRNKSRDNKKDESNDSDKQDNVIDSNKNEKATEEKNEKVEVMQVDNKEVDNKGDKPELQGMDVDGAASQ